jgi:hypothetical protein
MRLLIATSSFAREFSRWSSGFTLVPALVRRGVITGTCIGRAYRNLEIPISRPPSTCVIGLLPLASFAVT